MFRRGKKVLNFWSWPSSALLWLRDGAQFNGNPQTCPQLFVDIAKSTTPWRW